MKNKKKTKNVVTIGPKHQVVIPKEVRRRCWNFKKGAKVHVYSLDDSTLALRLEDGNWAQTQYGVLRDVLEGIDVEKALKNMRDEWD